LGIKGEREQVRCGGGHGCAVTGELTPLSCPGKTTREKRRGEALRVGKRWPQARGRKEVGSLLGGDGLERENNMAWLGPGYYGREGRTGPEVLGFYF
jgi:hypothetical protein